MKENKEENKQEKSTKKRKKIDKSSVAVKIVAIFLTLAMILPIVASAIFYIIGD